MRSVLGSPHLTALWIHALLQTLACQRLPCRMSGRWTWFCNSSTLGTEEKLVHHSGCCVSQSLTRAGFVSKTDGFIMERGIPTRVIAGQWAVWSVVSESGVQPEFTGVGQIGGWKGKLGLQLVRKAGTSWGELELASSSSLPVLVPQGVTCRGRWWLQTWSWYTLCPGLREADVREWWELGKLRSGADPSQLRGDLNQQGRVPAATESTKNVVLLLHFLLPNLVQNSPHGWHQQGTVSGEEFWEHSSISAQQTWYKTIPGAFGHSGLISSGVHFLMVSASYSLVSLQSTLHDKLDLLSSLTSSHKCNSSELYPRPKHYHNCVTLRVSSSESVIGMSFHWLPTPVFPVWLSVVTSHLLKMFFIITSAAFLMHFLLYHAHPLAIGYTSFYLNKTNPS